MIEQLKILNHSPIWDLEKLPEDLERKEIPTQKEFLQILQAADKNDQPLLLVLTHPLARIDKLLQLS